MPGTLLPGHSSIPTPPPTPQKRPLVGALASLGLWTERCSVVQPASFRPLPNANTRESISDLQCSRRGWCCSLGDQQCPLTQGSAMQDSRGQWGNPWKVPRGDSFSLWYQDQSVSLGKVQCLLLQVIHWCSPWVWKALPLLDLIYIDIFLSPKAVSV